MGADLFGSFAEATCAALVLIGGSYNLVNGGNLGSADAGKITAIYYPLVISAVGILCSLVSSAIGIWGYRVTEISRIEKALNLQLLVSTFLILVSLYFATQAFLPDSWTMNVNDKPTTVKWWYCYVSTSFGLVSGFLVGLSTDYYTSHAHHPVQEMANICTSGAAINIIYGLALGYLSTIIPIFLLSLTIIVSTYLLGMLGVALAAIGMLSNLAICLAIDAYGPISDNAGGIAEMCEIGEEVRAKTDALDAAGNTTAAVGKGFAIGSAALVSLALYGAFLTRCAVQTGKYFDKRAGQRRLDLRLDVRRRHASLRLLCHDHEVSRKSRQRDGQRSQKTVQG
jgi:Na+/H+-translocating membrane pyrophosphatase